jgi:hypothetical protein
VQSIEKTFITLIMYEFFKNISIRHHKYQLSVIKFDKVRWIPTTILKIIFDATIEGVLERGSSRRESNPGLQKFHFFRSSEPDVLTVTPRELVLLVSTGEKCFYKSLDFKCRSSAPF